MEAIYVALKDWDGVASRLDRRCGGVARVLSNDCRRLVEKRYTPPMMTTEEMAIRVTSEPVRGFAAGPERFPWNCGISALNQRRTLIHRTRRLCSFQYPGCL